MMREFITHLTAMNKETVHLIYKDRHVDLYTHFGFRYVKPSESDHGGMSWHEMVMML